MAERNIYDSSRRAEAVYPLTDADHARRLSVLLENLQLQHVHAYRGTNGDGLPEARALVLLSICEAPDTVVGSVTSGHDLRLLIEQLGPDIPEDVMAKLGVEGHPGGVQI